MEQLLIPKKTGTFKSYDGTRIYYEVRGEGKPLIFAYGIGCLMNHWRHQIRYFSKNYQTILFDFRAHHKSETPIDREHLTIDALSLDIQALMDHLQIQKAGVVGHSFGAQILIRFYDMFPDRVENLIFINGFVKNPIAGMFGNNLASSFFQIFRDGYSLLPETISFLFKQAITNPIAFQLSALAGGFNLHLTSLRDIEIYAKGVASLELDPFLCLFEKMMNYDGSSVLDRIQVPTLIIAGKKDSVTPQETQKEMHKRIKKSQFLMVPYGSHCTQLDMPDLVNLRMQNFYHNNKW